jgi:hypothetical protein
MLRNFRPSLLIEWVSGSSLRSDPQNPREHPDRQLKQIARSISTFGFLVPILADGNGNVIAGDARLRHAAFFGTRGAWSFPSWVRLDSPAPPRCWKGPNYAPVFLRRSLPSRCSIRLS